MSFCKSKRDGGQGPGAMPVEYQYHRIIHNGGGSMSIQLTLSLNTAHEMITITDASIEN